MIKNNTKNTFFSCFLILIFASFVFFCVFLTQTSFVFAQIDNDFLTQKINYSSTAKSAIMIETKTKRILYEKNINQELAMASTTKIMTAITAIENCEDLDKLITIDKRAVGVSGTSIYLKENEELTVRELLYGLMLRSGNDASVAIACAVSGGVEKFCDLMNELAKKIGANNTHFKNPHGLDEEGHYTTAYDLAIITAYALENPDFSEIVKTKTKRICQGKDNERYLINKNKLLSKLDGCIGVKTGFTDDAGRCLVSACERNNLRLVCVVFDCGPMFEESAEMFEKAYSEFEMLEVLPPYFFVDNIRVDGGECDFVGAYTKKGFSIPLKKEEKMNLNVVFNKPDSLVAPIKKDEAIGEVEIYYNNHLIFCEKIYTIDSIDSRLYKDKIKDILNNWNA